MLARWYSLFIGFLLVVLGIAGLFAAGSVDIGQGGITTLSIVWLITGAVALWMGFGVKNDRTVRTFALIVGALYFLWGIIQLLAAPAADSTRILTALASTAGFNLLLGALGLAAGLVRLPTWTEAEARPMAA